MHTQVIITRTSHIEGLPFVVQLRLDIAALPKDPDNSDLVDKIVTAITESGLKYDAVSLHQE